MRKGPEYKREGTDKKMNVEGFRDDTLATWGVSVQGKRKKLTQGIARKKSGGRTKEAKETKDQLGRIEEGRQ